jgi:hypothetical protein
MDRKKLLGIIFIVLILFMMLPYTFIIIASIIIFPILYVIGRKKEVEKKPEVDIEVDIEVEKYIEDQNIYNNIMNSHKIGLTNFINFKEDREKYSMVHYDWYMFPIFRMSIEKEYVLTKGALTLLKAKGEFMKNYIDGIISYIVSFGYDINKIKTPLSRCIRISKIFESMNVFLLYKNKNAKKMLKAEAKFPINDINIYAHMIRIKKAHLSICKNDKRFITSSIDGDLDINIDEFIENMYMKKNVDYDENMKYHLEHHINKSIH